MSTRAIGIDFGTTKTLVAYLNPREKRPETLRLGLGTDFVPTTAAIDTKGQLFFGNEAEDMLEDPSVAYLRGFKMELGSETPLYMLPHSDGRVKPVTAQELVTEFLRRLRLAVQDKVFMGGEVSEAVITRPVPFSPARCQALKEAALAAGFSKVTLTTEPEAAGLAFCRLNTAEAFKGNALVIDWGGGTLDIALVSREGDRVVGLSELTDGDMNVGGERFDERLWKYAEAQLGGARLNPATQMPRVRKAKEQLSSRGSTTLRLSAESGACPPIDITRERFESLIAADVDKAAGMVQALLARVPAAMKPEMLLLVGGSSAIPLIREKLEAATGLPARSWQDSREAVAMGAALMVNGGRSTSASVRAENADRGGSRLAPTEKSDEPATLQRQMSQDVANEKDRHGRTPLHRAARWGRTDEMRMLIEAGADVDAEDKSGETPLHEAAWGGHAEAVRLLLDSGADVEVRSEDGSTPLHKAARYGNTNAARLLLEAGADVNAEAKDGYTALHWAASWGYSEGVSLLLAAGADVNAKDKDGEPPLLKAARYGNVNEVRLLLDAGADINEKDKGGFTALHRAVMKEQMDTVRQLLKAGADVNGGSGWKQTPLDLAIQVGNDECASVLREHGGRQRLANIHRFMKILKWGLLAAVGIYLVAGEMIMSCAVKREMTFMAQCFRFAVTDKWKNTKLHSAALTGRLGEMRTLLAVGADVNAKNTVGWTPLHGAAWAGSTGSSLLLLASGADIPLALSDGWSELHLASSAGLTDKVRELLEAGASVYVKDEEGDTPLHRAARNGHSDAVRLLLSAGADVNAKDKDGWTPLHEAASRGHTDAARQLLAAGADVYAKRARDIRGYSTPLCLAIKNGHTGVVELLRDHELLSAASQGNVLSVLQLLESGADVNAKDEHGETPLHKAALAGHTDAVRLLLEAGADLQAALIGSWSELHFAASAGLTDRVRELLAAGADVNAKNEAGSSPLHWAAGNGHTDAVRLLLAAGADVNAKDKNGYTPLHRAAGNGHTDIVRLLLAAGADVNAKLEYGYTPLHLAADRGHTDAVRLLLEAGAEVNARDEDGWPPLHGAAYWGHADIVELLLAAGAKVNAKDNNGDTPLHGAALRGHTDAVRLLLAAGAEVNAKDEDGDTPLHGAALIGHTDVVRLLLAAGAEVNAKDEDGDTPLHGAAKEGHTDVVELLRAHGAKE